MTARSSWLKNSPFACLLLAFLLAAACTTRLAGTVPTGSGNVDKGQYSGKTIAILPVRAQEAQTTDSLLSLRMAINERLDGGLKGALPGSTIVGTKACTSALSDAGKLDTFDEIIRTYENTGVFDKKQIGAIASLLKADYVTFSRLKAEKMSFLGTKGFGASLEVVIIDKRTGEIAWGGTSEYKRGGIFGAGGTDNAAAAQQLVGMVLAKL